MPRTIVSSALVNTYLHEKKKERNAFSKTSNTMTKHFQVLKLHYAYKLEYCPQQC